MSGLSVISKKLIFCNITGTYGNMNINNSVSLHEVLLTLKLHVILHNNGTKCSINRLFQFLSFGDDNLPCFG